MDREKLRRLRMSGPSMYAIGGLFFVVGMIALGSGGGIATDVEGALSGLYVAVGLLLLLGFVLSLVIGGLCSVLVEMGEALRRLEAAGDGRAAENEPGDGAPPE